VGVANVQTVNKVGPLEYILNTPSHHRVHHGVNRYCIDKNFAGVFIVWDRLFGARTCCCSSGLVAIGPVSKQRLFIRKCCRLKIHLFHKSFPP